MYTRKLYRPKPAINDINGKASGYLARQISSFNLSDEYGHDFKASEQDPGYEITLEGVDHDLPDYLQTIADMPVIDNVMAQLIPSAPRITEHVIYNTLLTIFHRADSRIQITTPYFVPDESLIVALISAARRGVRVRSIDSLGTTAEGAVGAECWRCG